MSRRTPPGSEPDDRSCRIAPGQASEDFLPIADYAAVGNLWTAALVGRNGSVDWCCLPELSSPSIFAALLDRTRGGRFRVGPARPLLGRQYYEARTNVLTTEFRSPRGRFEVTDFMPLRGPLDGRTPERQASVFCRIIQAHEGEPEVHLEWSPRFDYARAPTRMRARRDGVVATGGSSAAALGLAGARPQLADAEHGPVARAALRLRAGNRTAVIMTWGDEVPAVDLDGVDALLRETVEAWQAWAYRWPGDDSTWGGTYHDQVVRSGLVLKLLTHPETGAIAAAPTTSLPEAIGGNRNWDYRYSWIRDAAFTSQALAALGHTAEALDFLLWAEGASAAGVGAGRHLQILYGLHGETDLTEAELPHLEGYRCSRPVRIGNAAVYQHQLDVYGELLGAAYEFLRTGGTISPDLWHFLSWVADETARRWREEDHGIWEIRGVPRHYVSSKAMAWMALDRALQLARRLGMQGNEEVWRSAREDIRDAVLAHGYNEKIGAFVQAFGSTELDASNLLIPLVGLLPFDDPRVRGTTERVLRDLTTNGLVCRYRAEDGLEGDEGAFGLTTFWMVDVLALSGRTSEAAELFAEVARRANHVGLFPEEFAPSGEFLGNFPQAFSHVGFVNSALYLGLAQGRHPTRPPPVGSREHRLETGHDPGAAA